MDFSLFGWRWSGIDCVFHKTIRRQDSRIQIQVGEPLYVLPFLVTFYSLVFPDVDADKQPFIGFLIYYAINLFLGLLSVCVVIVAGVSFLHLLHSPLISFI